MAQDKVTVSLQGNTVTATAVDVSAATVPASSVNFVGAQGPRGQVPPRVPALLRPADQDVLLLPAVDPGFLPVSRIHVAAMAYARTKLNQSRTPAPARSAAAPRRLVMGSRPSAAPIIAAVVGSTAWKMPAVVAEVRATPVAKQS